MTRFNNNKFDDVIRNELEMTLSGVPSLSIGCKRDFDLCMSNFMKISDHKMIAFRGTGKINQWSLLQLVDSQMKYLTLAHNLWIDDFQTSLQRSRKSTTKEKVMRMIKQSFFQRNLLKSSCLYNILKKQKEALWNNQLELWKLLFKRQIEWSNNKDLNKIVIPERIVKRMNDDIKSKVSKTCHDGKRFPDQLLGATDIVKIKHKDAKKTLVICRYMKSSMDHHNMKHISYKHSIESLLYKFHMMGIPKIHFEPLDLPIDDTLTENQFELIECPFEFDNLNPTMMKKEQIQRSINIMEKRLLKNCLENDAPITVIFTHYLGDEIESRRSKLNQQLIQHWNTNKPNPVNAINITMDSYDDLESLVFGVVKNNMMNEAG